MKQGSRNEGLLTQDSEELKVETLPTLDDGDNVRGNDPSRDTRTQGDTQEHPHRSPVVSVTLTSPDGRKHTLRTVLKHRRCYLSL